MNDSSREEEMCVECIISDDGENNNTINQSISSTENYTKDEDNLLMHKNKLSEENKDKYNTLTKEKKIILKCVTSSIIINKL